MALIQIDVTRLAALGTALEADKAALEAKGVEVPEGTKLDDIAGLIRTAKNVTMASGTVTLASDSTSLTVQTGVSNVKEIIIIADITDPAVPSNLSVFKAVFSKDAQTTFESTAINPDTANAQNGFLTYKGTATRYASSVAVASFSDGEVSIQEVSASGPFFRTGLQYQWVAYGWNHVIPHRNDRSDSA